MYLNSSTIKYCVIYLYLSKGQESSSWLHSRDTDTQIAFEEVTVLKISDIPRCKLQQNVLTFTVCTHFLD